MLFLNLFKLQSVRSMFSYLNVLIDLASYLAYSDFILTSFYSFSIFTFAFLSSVR